jgi:predicted RND superfamily exporter protein
VLFVASASRMVVDAGFNKMVPLKHEYMKVYREYEKVFGGANRVALALVQKDGDIYNKEFMAKLKGLTDDVFLLNGVDRPSVKSLFTPNTRFIEVIEEGFAGGNVIPATFQGTDATWRRCARTSTSRPRSGARWPPTSPARWSRGPARDRSRRAASG